MDPPPPPPSPPSSYASFPILVITILGILATAILLIGYYAFAVKCHLTWRRPDLLRHFSTSPTSRHVPAILGSFSTAALQCHGLDPAAIRSLPIAAFSKTSANPHESCAVCLSKFHQQDRLRLLPDCSHAFHVDCIDTWLQSSIQCPLCRREIITSQKPFSSDPIGFTETPSREQELVGGSFVIEVRGGEGSWNHSPSKREKKQGRKQQQHHKLGSQGDECIDHVREKEEQFCVQPIRRSLSMDSSNDRQLYLSVQEILRQKPPHYLLDIQGGGGGGGGGIDGRIRRSFFSFRQCRSLRNAMLPMQIDL